MKKILSLFTVVILSATIWAQSPQKMSYQSVVRDSNGDLVKSASVDMQISILQGAADGAVVYAETQAPSTNENGLLSVEIGAGTTSDDFSAINWSNGPMFVKTEIDIDNDGTYDITSTSELLSVPYAIHAESSANASQLSEEIMNILSKHDIGTVSILSGDASVPQDTKKSLRMVAKPDFTANRYSWDFGDGKTVTDTVAPGVNHTYAAPGSYNVSLTASSDVLSNSVTEYDFVQIVDTVIQDIDGNKYGEMTYGNQKWLVGSMISKTDTAGNSIPVITDEAQWDAIANDPDVMARAWANYDPATGVLLYNFGAAKHVCPKGYHLPTKAEWQELETYMTNTYTDVNPTKALAARSGWTGASAVENTPYVDQYKNNGSGFTAIPAPVRMVASWGDGPMMSEGDNRFSFFWTSDNKGNGSATANFIYYKNTSITYADYYYKAAYQVRCVKD